LAERGAWRGKTVVRELAPLLSGCAVPRLDELLAPAYQHYIPAHIARSLQLPPFADGRA